MAKQLFFFNAVLVVLVGLHFCSVLVTGVVVGQCQVGLGTCQENQCREVCTDLGAAPTGTRCITPGNASDACGKPRQYQSCPDCADGLECVNEKCTKKAN